jgi:HK97 family phage portal protein
LRLLNFLRRFLPETKTLSVDNAWALLFPGYQTASAISVNEHSALQCPAARAAVAVLSESVAQLPLHLYRRDGDSKDRAVDHPLYPILLSAANDWTSAFEWRRSMMVALLLQGHAFSFINRSRATGEIVELVQIPSHAVSVEVDDVTQEPSYWVQDPVRRQIDRSQIFHLQALNGEAPIMQAKEAIGLSLVMERHAAQLFGNGARPAGMLRLKGRLTPASLERLQADFQQKYGGLSNQRTLILEDDAQFEPLTMNSVDTEFTALRKFQVQEIARHLRVPEHLLGLWERATWSNAETAGRQFLAYTLLPWLELWQQGIQRSLLSPTERSIYYAEFLTDDLVRADLAARYEAYSKAVLNGILTAAEVRAMENRPPLPGSDVLRTPMNTEPSDQPEPAA